MAYKHDIDIKWFICNVNTCKYHAKTAGDLKQHKANKHNIDVKWITCDVANCPYRAKQQSNIQTHKEHVHDIGAHLCDVCLGCRNSHIPYTDAGGDHHVCRACYNKATGKRSRVEHDMSAYLDALPWLRPHLVSSDRAFRAVGGCQLYRPDKLYIIDGGIEVAEGGMPSYPHRLVLHVECDEHGHERENGTYQCDEKRISDCYDEVDCAHYVVVRWNPHSYTRPEGTSQSKILRATRLEALAEQLKHIVAAPPREPLYIYYMYYGADNPRIARAIPHELLYGAGSFDLQEGSARKRRRVDDAVSATT